MSYNERVVDRIWSSFIRKAGPLQSKAHVTELFTRRRDGRYSCSVY